MSSQLRKGALELCVLSLLLYEDLYGYELIKIISETFPVSEGTIYPILRRLTKNNYLKTYTAAFRSRPVTQILQSNRRRRLISSHIKIGMA